MTVVVTNTGDTITGAVVAATSSDPQLVVVSPDTTCTGTLDVNQSCNLVLSVTPTALGAPSGTPTVTVATTLSGTTDVPATVTATWTGVLAAKITPTPTAHDFGNQSVGVKSSAFTINLANVASGLATGPLSFSVDDPDFAVSAVSATPAASTDCGNTAFLTNGLAGGANCNIFATFTPQALASAAKSGTITVQYYTSDVPPVLVKVPVTLNGTAIAALSLTAEAPAASAQDKLESGVGCVFTAASGTTLASCAYPAASIMETTFESETFTFMNASAAPTTGLLVASLGGTNAGEFRIVNDMCTGTTVAQSGTCTVTVRFSPSSSSTTAKTASLMVGGTPGDSVTVNLTGVGNP